MLTALFLLEIGLKVVILAVLWLIWSRMDRFEDQLDYIEEWVAEAKADAEDEEKP